MKDNKFDESILEEEQDKQEQEGYTIPIHDSSEEETAGQKEEAGESESTASQDDVTAEAETESEDSKEADAEAEKDGKGKKNKKKKSAGALEIELKKCQEKIDEYADRYQRLLAEFENARARSAREQSHMYDAGAKDILAKLLPVIDNFERGIEGLSDAEKEDPFAQGVIKIYQQLTATLEESGVKPMDPVGKEFDPEYHNAVMHEDNEEMGENLVAEEFLKGYMYKDEVLRHSMVKVVN